MNNVNVFELTRRQRREMGSEELLIVERGSACNGERSAF